MSGELERSRDLAAAEGRALAQTAKAGSLVPGAHLISQQRLEVLPNDRLIPILGSIVGFGASQLVTLLPGPLSTAAFVTFLAGCASVVALAPWRRRSLHRRLERASPLTVARECQGRLVRVQGIVQARGGTFTSALGRQAVLARYLGSRGRIQGPGRFSRAMWERHGLDFSVQALDGQEIWVESAHLALLPHPPVLDPRFREQRPVFVHDGSGTSAGREGRASWVYVEEVIGPGDMVEVAGVLELVPHVAGSAGSDREPRLAPVLRGRPGRPVLVQAGAPAASRALTPPR
jgi:hypothetical protein